MAIARYFISGVWKDSAGVITHVFLHNVLANEKDLDRGVKYNEASIIDFVEKGGIIKTIVWNYTKALWTVGAVIIVVHEGGRKFLRTKGDGTVRDNLDNLLNMRHFIS